MYKNTKIDFNLIKKYDKPGPRYTSYPTAVEFKPLSSDIYKKELEDILHDERPLSLYVHIPFCENACWFCGCNVIISHRTDVAKPYLNYLFKEVDMLKDVLKDYKKIDQFHIGGGTPNFLDNEDFYDMMSFIKDRFDFTEDPEVSIEIDPRHIDYKKLKLYKELGFNRISMGIQDFDRNVQERINRVQDEELLKNVIYDIRSLGYKSLNIDLMYGLPGQTVDTFKSTIEKTIELSPDRVAVFNFAYVPWLKPLQRKIDATALPEASMKLDMLKLAIELFEASDYAFIGMDHFAKKTDDLYLAQKHRKLWRNFQGYTTRKGDHLIGIGATSIGMLDKAYFQNHKTLRDYYSALDKGVFPIMRGYILNQDDIIRREVIMDIMCNLYVDKMNISSMFGIDFDEYFEKELLELEELECDGLVSINKDKIEVNPEGRLLVRNIAIVFDIYSKAKEKPTFSRTI